MASKTNASHGSNAEFVLDDNDQTQQTDAARDAADSAFDDDGEDGVDESQYITVALGARGLTVPGKEGATRIFHEFDTRHPGNEVLVTGGAVVKVYPSQAVREAIASKILREVRDAKPTPPRLDMADIMDATPEDRAQAEAQAAETKAAEDAVLADARKRLARANSGRGNGRASDR